MVRKTAGSWILDVSVALFLTAFFSLKLFFASQGKPFWMDESDALYATVRSSFAELVLNGSPSGQASKSPLPYLIDWLWMSIWDLKPQTHWDLRFFSRVPAVLFWALTNVFVFFFLRKKVAQYLPGNAWAPWLISSAATLFYYSNNFASYYAIEARAYSLWLALSTVHLLLTWDCVSEEDKKKPWCFFYIISVLLIFCTYTSALQIAMATAVLFACAWRPGMKLSALLPLAKKVAVLLLLTAPLTIYYFLQLAPMSFGRPTWEIYRLAVMEVVLKSFHHHSYHPILFTGPLIFVFLPLYWWKRDRNLSILAMQAIAVLLISLLIFLVSRAKGGLYASRYVIYAVPALTFSYMLCLFTVGKIAAQLAPQKIRQKVLLALLTIWSISELAGRPISIYKGAPADIARFKARNSYGYNDNPACAELIPHAPESLEQLNDICRKITN